MSKAPHFFDKCYDVARQIPVGRVTSYGAIATYLGAARSARMVGYAMTASHGKDVPVRKLIFSMVFNIGWHVLYVKSRWEKKVHESLLEILLEPFLPHSFFEIQNGTLIKTIIT